MRIPKSALAFVVVALGVQLLVLAVNSTLPLFLAFTGRSVTSIGTAMGALHALGSLLLCVSFVRVAVGQARGAAAFGAISVVASLACSYVLRGNVIVLVGWCLPWVAMSYVLRAALRERGRDLSNAVFWVLDLLLAVRLAASAALMYDLVRASPTAMSGASAVMTLCTVAVLSIELAVAIPLVVD